MAPRVDQFDDDADSNHGPVRSGGQQLHLSKTTAEAAIASNAIVIADTIAVFIAVFIGVAIGVRFAIGFAIAIGVPCLQNQRVRDGC